MKLVAIIAASLLSVSAFAQTGAVQTETTAAGLLGKRYVEAGLGWVDYRHSSRDGFGAGVDVNVPVHTNIDVNLSYQHSYVQNWINIGDYVGTSVTGYFTRGDSKPYARLGLGYSWSQSWIDSDHGVWNGEVGIERSVNDKVSASFSVGYDDDFRSHSDGLWNVAVGGTYAFCPKVVGTAKISYIEYGSVGYTVGLAYRF